MSFYYRDAVLREGQGLSNRFDAAPKFLEFRVTTEPSIDLVALADMKNELRNRHSEDDSLLENYITQAMKDVEEFTGRALADQEITAYWKFVYDYVYLPRPPQQSITSVTEIDDDGTETTISSSDYDVFGDKELKIEFDSPVYKQLEIVYDVGYGSAVADIPRWAKSAVQWQTKLYYQKSEDPNLAVDASSGLALPAFDAAKNHQYYLPE